MQDPSLDFDGDSGVIGTIKSSDNSLHLDIKGQLYDGSVLPCNTMMVVDVGPSEIRVEAVMHDFVQLHEVSNPHDEDVDVELSDDGSRPSYPACNGSGAACTDARRSVQRRRHGLGRRRASGEAEPGREGQGCKGQGGGQEAGTPPPRT